MKTKNDPAKFNQVSRKRHLNLNKLLKEHFTIQKKSKISEKKKNRK